MKTFEEELGLVAILFFFVGIFTGIAIGYLIWN